MDFISRLPGETLYKIFDYLEGNQLAKCSNVCRRFYAAANDDDRWKKLCGFDWLIFELPNNAPAWKNCCFACVYREYGCYDVLPNNVSTWKNCYACMYREYGCYVKCYSRVKRCWDKIFAVAQERCPVIYDSLQRDGTSENSLDEVQTWIGSHAKLPLEYRCSYRLCDGQTGCYPFFGLFGSYSVDEHDGDYMCRCPGDGQSKKWTLSRLRRFRRSCLSRCCLSFVFITDVTFGLPIGRLALCIRDSAASETRRNCVLNGEHENLDGRVVSIRDDDASRRLELFVCSNTFIDFLEDFANRIGDFPVVNNRFLKYDFHSTETTGPFTVIVRTAHIRDRTHINWDTSDFKFLYRITMKMHPDAPESNSCQLATGHWIITDANGKVETKTEPGVDGDNPVMRPGAEFTLTSRTAFATTAGKVSGYFIMTKLDDGSECRIDCPEFVLVAPPVVKA